MKTDRSLAVVVVVLVVLVVVAAIGVGYLYVRSRQPGPAPTAVAPGPIAATTSSPLPPPTPTQPEEAVEVIIPDTTKVLSGDTVDSLTSISGDGAVFTFSEPSPELEGLERGDVMVSDVSAQAPAGFLRKVTAVRSDADEVVVETESATLEDAIEQGSLALTRILTPGEVQGGRQLQGVALAALPLAPGPDRFVVSLDDVVLYDLDGDHATPRDQVRANGTLWFEPEFSFELKLKGFRLERLSLTTSATESVYLQITGELQILDLHEEVQVAYYVLQPITFWVGWVPVVLTPVLTVNVGLDGTATVGFEVDVTQEATLTAGLRYAGGRWSPKADFTNDFGFTPPTLTGNLDARAYAGLELAILVYGIAGPYGGIYGFLELDADINRVPWWELHGGLEAVVGVRVEILGTTVADHPETVLDRRFLLAQGETRPTDTPIPTPTPTPTPTRTPTPTPTATPTPTPTPKPPCAFDAEGQFAGLWQTYKDRLGCPLYQVPRLIQDAEQAFENGHMFWRADTDYVYVVYEAGGLAGKYQAFPDQWSEGDPRYSCEASPPPGRVQPERGLGYVWCLIGGPDAAIGWGLGEEGGKGPGNGDPLVQDFEGGLIFRDSDGTVRGMAYVLFDDADAFARVSY